MAQDKEKTTKEQTRSYQGRSQSPTSYQPASGKGRSLTARADSGPSMALSRGSPFSTMRRLMEDMDRMFSGFGTSGRSLFAEPWYGESNLEQSFWAPQVETFRRGDELVVRADLPGMNKENVNVEFEDDTLIISGERQDEYQEERDDFYRTERSYGRFYRAIPLPEGVDADRGKAEFKDGVLEVSMPAPREAARKSKRIDIK
ncbi:MAG TPA: Hsp20/alpha crystallin family protein [Longimicrobiales bacterium]